VHDVVATELRASVEAGRTSPRTLRRNRPWTNPNRLSSGRWTARSSSSPKKTFVIGIDSVMTKRSGALKPPNAASSFAAALQSARESHA